MGTTFASRDNSIGETNQERRKGTQIESRGKAFRRFNSRISLTALNVCFTWRGPIVEAETSVWTGHDKTVSVCRQL